MLKGSGCGSWDQTDNCGSWGLVGIPGTCTFIGGEVGATLGLGSGRVHCVLWGALTIRQGRAGVILGVVAVSGMMKAACGENGPF